MPQVIPITPEIKAILAAQGIDVPTEKKPSKFHAVKTELDGIVYDSAAESRYIAILKMRERAGEIKDLETRKEHLRYPLIVNGQKICVYEADARYIDVATGETVTCDCKGFKTPIYRLKCKLMSACLGITITEVASRSKM